MLLSTCAGGVLAYVKALLESISESGGEGGI